MKKILFALLFVLVIISCSKDSSESDIIPSDGQYVGYVKYESEYSDDYNDYSSTFCIIIANGRCEDFVIYNGSERFSYYNPTDISTQGSFPKYTYRINDFTVNARYSNLENFTADMSGILHTHEDGVHELIEEINEVLVLEAKGVLFRLDNTPLDANNDGILDSKQ